MNAKSVRVVQKVERPRPLKLSADIGTKCSIPGIDSEDMKKPITDIWNDLQAFYMSLSDCNYDENTATEIAKICSILKTRGAELDISNKSLVDHYFVTFRNASREDRLDAVSRIKLLEVIELRAMKWQTNENIMVYYKKKITELEGTEKIPTLISPSIAYNYSSLLPNQPSQTPATTISVPLAPGEILRSSGKFAKPTKIAGKNYFKDEVVIRNSDSGKVMGIKGRRVHMIEELSDTIISFQRVNPGARDRLVQITGPHEEAISHAKTLVEDTIRRNASPMREKTDSIGHEECNRMMSSMNFDEAQEFSSRKHQLEHSFSMGDATLGEYTSKLQIGSDCITLCGANVELLKVAKIALQAYFSGRINTNEKTNQHVIFQTDNRNISNISDMDLKNRLERSSSWMSSVGSRASISPFESSSDDETFKEYSGTVNQSNFADLDLANKNHLSMHNRHTSLNSDITMETSEQVDRDIQEFSRSLSSGSVETEAPHFIPPPGPRVFTYTREELMKFSESPLCKTTGMKLNEEVIENYPFVLRSSAFRGNADPEGMRH